MERRLRRKVINHPLCSHLARPGDALTSAESGRRAGLHLVISGAMGDNGTEPRLLVNRFADAVGPSDAQPDRDRCRCGGHSASTQPATVAFHRDRQDTESPGWRHLLTLVEEAATDGRTVFSPFAELSAAERRQIVTLPPTIGPYRAARPAVTRKAAVTTRRASAPELSRLSGRQLTAGEVIVAPRKLPRPFKALLCTPMRPEISDHLLLPHAGRSYCPTLCSVSPTAPPPSSDRSSATTKASRLRSSFYCASPARNAGRSATLWIHSMPIRRFHLDQKRRATSSRLPGM